MLLLLSLTNKKGASPPLGALNWGGALHIQGSEGLLIERCTFSRLDGNAVFLGGANYHAMLAENEFVLLRARPPPVLQITGALLAFPMQL